MSHRHTMILVFCLSCLLFFGFVPASQAADHYWVGSTGDWSNAANWSGTEPTSSGDAYIYSNGIALITQEGEVCSNLCLGDSFEGNTGSVIMTGGSLTISKYLKMGKGGNSAFNQYGGNVSAGTIWVSYNRLFSGIHNIAGGSLTAGSLQIGHGIFNQSGGIVTASHLTIADGSGAGTYNFTGGTLVVGLIGGSTFNFGGGTIRPSCDLTTSEAFKLTGIGGNANFDTNGYSFTCSNPYEAISGPGGLNKLGEGVLTLATANTYSGNTTVNAGTLKITTAAALPGYDTAGRVSVYDGGTMAVNYGGASDWNAADVNTLINTATFYSGSLFGFDTTNAAAGAVYGNAINGILGVAKLGDNSLTLSGANTYTEVTTIDAGTLLATTTAALPGYDTAGRVSVYDGGTMAVNYGGPGDWSATDVHMLINTASFYSGSLCGFDTTNAAGGAVYGNAINGILGVAKLGNNSLTLSGVNSYAGVTTVDAGTLLATITAALPGYDTAGRVSVAGGGTMAVNYGGTSDWNAADVNILINTATFYSGSFFGFDTTNATGGAVYGNAINGIFGVAKLGDNSLTLSGANTYTGGTTLSAGRLNIDNATALGAGALTISGTSTIGNTSGAAVTLANDNLQSWNADLTFVGGSDLDLGNGAVTLGGNRQITVSSNELTVGGAIGGDYSLTKAGSGTLALGGANAYTGNTTISAGTLKLGSEASLASGAIDVAAGATFDVSEVSGGYNLTAGQTLNGAGVVGGDITISGIHAPGYSPGIQIIQGDYNMLGELQIELAGTAPGADYDQVLLSGSGDYDATLGGTLTLDWTGFGDSSEETQLWIIQNDTDGILTGEFDDYANGSSLGVHDDLEWWIWYGADAAAGALTGGNDVLIGAVPEPSMLVLIGIAAIALSAHALRRRKLNRGLV